MSDQYNWHNRLNKWIKARHKKPWTRRLKIKEWRGADIKVVWIEHNKVNQKLEKQVYYQVSY